MAITTETGIVSGLRPPIWYYRPTTTAKQGGMPHVHGFLGTGYPIAFTPGSPGLAGANVDGTTSTLGGTFPFVNPSSGNTYLAKFSATVGSSGTSLITLFDLLWYNSGITVTTTTAQTIGSGTLPARDNTGSTSGFGVFAALYASATIGASGAVNNTTISYTNTSGTSGQVGGLAMGWPTTATAGSLIPFALQGNDLGVQSIQSLTLGTSYVSGTLNLLLIRPITSFGVPQTLTGLTLDWAQLGFPRLYDGTALSFWAVPGGSTTLGTITGEVTYAQG